MGDFVLFLIAFQLLWIGSSVQKLSNQADPALSDNVDPTFTITLPGTRDAVMRRCQQALAANSYSKASKRGFLDIKSNAVLGTIDAEYKVVWHRVGERWRSRFNIVLTERGDQTEIVATARGGSRDQSESILVAFREGFA